MAEEEPKVFIDEDWKSRVQREKEEARKRLEAEAEAKAKSAAAAPPAGPAPAMPGAPDAEAEEGAPFEATFDALLQSLATQAIFALGFIAQEGQQVMVNLDQAKFTIDIIAMLKEKTRGNLTLEETGGLDETLSELQRLFVARIHQLEAQAMKQAGIDPAKLRGAPPV